MKKCLSVILILMCTALFFACSQISESDWTAKFYIKDIRCGEFVLASGPYDLQFEDQSFALFEDNLKRFTIYLCDGENSFSRIEYTITQITKDKNSLTCNVERIIEVKNDGKITYTIQHGNIWTDNKLIYLEADITYKISSDIENAEHPEDGHVTTVSRRAIVATFARITPEYMKSLNEETV